MRRSRARRRLSRRFAIEASHVALTVLLLIANTIAAGITLLLIALVIPGSGEERASVGANMIVLGGFALVTLPTILVWASRTTARTLAWLREDREPTESERLALLRAPWRVMRVVGAGWLVATLIFFGFNTQYSMPLAIRVGITVLLTGTVMAAWAFLFTERLLRSAAIEAIERGGPIDRAVAAGVVRRQLLGWTTATGAPTLGIVAVGILALAGVEGTTPARLGLTMVVLGATVLVFGLVVELVAARAVADPIRTVRKALDRVGRGDLEGRVPVYDASEIGRLQEGFNRMVVGLRERERLHDLFGRHVGEDVARVALESDVRLGGEVREVCALFVDIVGSTALAAEREPDEVVVLLNRFFAVVVSTVERHGGWVNKFEGDAALVVFGAPVDQADAPDRALAAARELGRRLREEVGELRAGIGVSGGRAVAGYLGAETRLEYTVIGDPINEAARLTEVAKEVDGGVAAAGRLVARAGEQERARWVLDHRRTLRGRDAETEVMAPVAT
ncbi:adenylate/guanylate cyclase domain-containing protein [Patulibacter brassicae]|uniref:Adenylate/guanylate cyclase domain-containing protein n=1 Tax=Patulibacter brassicae TaxID=1705717 RepID=A0ABU4VPV5_9ACTN|nr:adenylate/guanylate cyclase domain-containing protein [Patulibacter brassicae]MDX8152868.1 adenylate/guanylate cyclase domain-containing protein [Patulibacter brassicae]